MKNSASGGPVRTETGGILIRGLIVNDADGFRAMREDKRIYRFEPVFLPELQGTAQEALLALADADLEKNRQRVLGVFERSAPGVLAGLAEFYDYKPSGKVVSIGYRLRPEFWGRGIGSLCVRAMLDYLKSGTRVKMVTAHVIPENKASSRILLKNGFEYLVTKTEDWGHGALTEAEVYTLDL